MRNWTNSNFFSTYGWFHNAATWLAKWSKIPWNIKSISCHYVGCYYGNYFGEFGITATRIFSEFYFIVCKNSNTGRSGTDPCRLWQSSLFRSVVAGFIQAAAFTIPLGQLKKIFGVHVDGQTFFTKVGHQSFVSSLLSKYLQTLLRFIKY